MPKIWDLRSRFEQGWFRAKFRVGLEVECGWDIMIPVTRVNLPATLRTAGLLLRVGN